LKKSLTASAEGAVSKCDFNIMMDLEIITPKGIEFAGPAEKIILPATTGEITVLPDHMPLISVLKAGKMKIIAENKETEKEIEGGVLEVGKGKIIILLKKF